MTIVLVCIGFAVLISLFTYVDNENWRSFHSQLYQVINKEKTPKNYGYQNALNLQNWTLSIICCVVVALFSLGYFGQTIVNNFDGPPKEDTASDLSDTTAFTLNDIETDLPPAEFNYQGDGGDGQPEAQEGIDNPDENSDNSEISDARSKPKETKDKMEPDESVYDLEKRYRESLGGDKKRKELTEDAEKFKENIKNKSNKQKVDGGVGGTQGTQSGSDGVTMVEWPKKERPAYNNDDWNIRVPGYTCGIGVNEKVVLKLHVEMSGKVLRVEVVSGSHPCCIEQAKKYAKLSKFEASDKMLQEINVTYRFKSQ